MYTTKKGKRFGSAFVGKKHDAMDAMKESPEHEAKETPEFEAGEKEGMKEAKAGSENAPEGVVAKHGKAVSVHVKHDHTANKHHVTSTHADGHVNESDHMSASEAHDAAQKRAGGDSPVEESDMPSEDESAPEADGFKMPRLA